MFKLLKYFRWYYWLLMIVLILFVILQVYFDLQLPQLMQKVVDVRLDSNGSTKAILMVGLEMVWVSFAGFVMMIVMSLLSSIISSNFSKDLRKRVYDKIEELSIQDTNQFSTASLITRTTNDIQQVQLALTMFLRMAFVAPFLAGMAISRIVGYSMTMSMIVAVSVFVIVLSIALIFLYAIPKFKLVQKYIDQMNLVTRENLTGIRVVRAYNAEQYQEDKFEKVNHDLSHTYLKTNRAMSFMNPVMQLAMNGTSLAIFWFGAYLFSYNKLTFNAESVSQLMAFSTYAIQIVMSFMMLTFLFVMIPRANISTTRIIEVLNTKNKILEPTVSKKSQEIGTVEFRNVSFKYPGASGYVLENISFKINRGETVAFLGSTGSGKTTVINLIPRFFDVTEGEVIVDGVNIKEYSQEELQKLLGIVPQVGLLFRGSIASNIKLGKPDASEAEIWEALRIAQAAEFVSKLEQGLEYEISQGGKNVSGGQKQRLCIARAIVKNPEIYIFDDSFSALDNQTDKLVRNALFSKTRNSTNLIVATRIGTIINADKIILLEEGKLIGMGTHKELLKNSTVYQEIAYSQLSKEELDHESSTRE